MSLSTMGLTISAVARGPASLADDATLAVVLRLLDSEALMGVVARGGLAAGFVKKLAMLRWPMMARQCSAGAHLLGTARFEKTVFGAIRRADASVDRIALTASL